MNKRNYRHEYELRKASHKRMAADIQKDKAERLEAFLKGRGYTFARWLSEHIENDLKGL